jgi:glucan 1,3-beta-glucosidase
VNPEFLPNLVLDNVLINNVEFLVFVSGSTNYLEGQSGPITIQSWAMGNRYTTTDGKPTNSIGFLSPVPNKAPVLLDSSGNFFTRSKPQYETLSLSSFIVITSLGVSNDGTGDQSAAINAALLANVGSVVFFPAGVYRVMSTVFVPANSKIVGEGAACSLSPFSI